MSTECLLSGRHLVDTQQTLVEHSADTWWTLSRHWVRLGGHTWWILAEHTVRMMVYTAEPIYCYMIGKNAGLSQVLVNENYQL